MSPRPAPAWLAELQSRFGAVLRTPLDRATGTLRAATEGYAPEALGDVCEGPRDGASAARLAVYNRQYWFRLFRVMHTAFPLTTRLLGHWRLNDYSARFLLARPPRSWDLDAAPDGFAGFLAEALGDGDDAAVYVEAARIDAAWREVFRAPESTPFRPRAEDAARLLDMRLERSPATALVVERWPLLELKRALAGTTGEAPVPAPAPLPRPRAWALVREPAGIRHHALEAREGELLELLERCTVRDALARLEAACTPDERAALPANAQRWLARGVERGLWRAPVADDVPDDAG